MNVPSHDAASSSTATPVAPQSEIRKGLAGVVVDTTSISKVVPETNSLTYRGYAVQDLAAHCSLEQVAYLMWHGELPTDDELAALVQTERSQRELDPTLVQVIDTLPTTCHPMDVVRTAVSWLGAADPAEDDPSNNQAAAERMWAQLPTIVAIDIRRRRGEAPVPPRCDLSFSENFLWMSTGQDPKPEVVRAFEISMVLYAEHSFNASTFTARVVTSTLSDIYSAVTAGIGALKGPLHGGANEAVMHMMIEIGDPAKAPAYLRDRLSRKEKVMGFGHRVYRNGDSRVPTMRTALGDLVQATGEGEQWLQMYEVLEQEMAAATRRTAADGTSTGGIKPNLDFPAGPTYYLMGLPIESFTPIFVMSRITGWTAHVMEQLASNALIRPLSAYDGPAQRAVPVFG